MFHAHGEHSVSLTDDILTVEAKGPFNIEQIACYQEALKSVLSDVKPPWAQLNLLHKDCLFTPQGEKDLADSIQLRKDYGLCAIAVVFVDSGLHTIAEQQLKKVYSEHNINYDCFDNKEQALKWLKQQIAKAS